jgi:hypothetical protein
MMRSRWSSYFLLVFFTLIVFSVTLSPVAQTQPREADHDDEEVLNQPPPDGIELRVFIHRPRVLKPRHLGTCVPTEIDSDYFESTPWHLSGPITWSLNRSTVPSSIASSVDGVLNEAAAQWSSGAFSQGPDNRAKGARLDNINAILFKPLGRSTIGVTFVWYSRSSGALIEADTLFNKRHPWAIFESSPECQSSPNAYDFQNIATHEFGHWVGLDDLFDDADKDLTMFGFSAGGEVKKRTLERGDVIGKNAVLR